MSRASRSAQADPSLDPAARGGAAAAPRRSRRASGTAPTGRSASDGTFTMSIEDFFRNFSAVDSGVFPKS